MVNENVIRLLKKLGKSEKGRLKDSEQKKLLGISGDELGDMRRLAKRCGYIKILNNQTVEITPEGAKIIVEEEKIELQNKANKEILKTQKSTIILLIITAVLTGLAINHEIYLTYPHFGIFVDCPKNVYETTPQSISTGIENYGKYADQVTLTTTSNGVNYDLKVGNDQYDSSKNITYVVAAGDTLTSSILLTNKTGNFTIKIQYNCQSIIKDCDFWTAKEISCKYVKDGAVWNLHEKILPREPPPALRIVTPTVGDIISAIILVLLIYLPLRLLKII